MSHVIASIEDLEALYGQPNAASTVKEAARITPQYRALIEASPFVALATSGPEGLDCSPRGDAGQVVVIQDETTLLMPDRRGNNRTDSLRNIIRDPRVALMFLIPGLGNAMRVNGRAIVSVDPDLIGRLTVDGQAPRSVIVITVEAAYFQCARAIVRSDLWNPDRFFDAAQLPTAGQILQTMSQGEEGGPDYDAGWAERAGRTLW